MKHAVVIGVVAGLTAAVVLVLLWLVAFFMVGDSGSHHVVELDPKGEPTYTVVH
jgi:hypothetical protein